jgi:hypothetical protein
MKKCPRCKKEPKKDIWYSEKGEFICEVCWEKILCKEK